MNQPTTPTSLPRPLSCDPPPIDMAVLLEQCMGSAHIALLVLEKLEQQIAHDLQEFAESTASHVIDAYRISRTAHSLKGASGLASAEALAKNAERLESLAKASKPTNITRATFDEALRDLRHTAQQCVAAIPVIRQAIMQTARLETSNQARPPSEITRFDLR